MPVDIPPMNQSLSDHYERAAPRWSATISRLGYPDAYRALIESARLSPSPGSNVADVGCGTGAMMRAFVGRHGRLHHLTLIDPADRMLAEAAKGLGDTLATKTISATLETVDAGEFDVLLCAHVVEHSADLSFSLRRLRAMLRPGGHLILVASKPHWCTWLLRRVWGHRSIKSADMTRALRAADFTVISEHGFAKGPPRRMSHAYIATGGERS